MDPVHLRDFAEHTHRNFEQARTDGFRAGMLFHTAQLEALAHAARKLERWYASPLIRGLHGAHDFISGLHGRQSAHLLKMNDRPLHAAVGGQNQLLVLQQQIDSFFVAAQTVLHELGINYREYRAVHAPELLADTDQALVRVLAISGKEFWTLVRQDNGKELTQTQLSTTSTVLAQVVSTLQAWYPEFVVIGHQVNPGC